MQELPYTNNIAAVAESAPTIRCLEEQKIANIANGSSIVYIPVINGIPAIVEYPITSGIAILASTIPANALLVYPSC